MAAIHLSEPIRQFPANLDREHFGHFISGFAAGEASFTLSLPPSPVYKGRSNGVPTAKFNIDLRADDKDVLDLIRAYFQCGKLYYHDYRSKRQPNAKPQLTYRVSDHRNLARVIVPHFERHPLFAKKSHDFEIWKQGVFLIHSVTSRKAISGKNHRGKFSGMKPRWTEPLREQFIGLAKQLKDARLYQDPFGSAFVAGPMPTTTLLGTEQGRLPLL